VILSDSRRTRRQKDRQSVAGARPPINDVKTDIARCQQSLVAQPVNKSAWLPPTCGRDISSGSGAFVQVDAAQDNQQSIATRRLRGRDSFATMRQRPGAGMPDFVVQASCRFVRNIVERWSQAAGRFGCRFLLRLPPNLLNRPHTPLPVHMHANNSPSFRFDVMNTGNVSPARQSFEYFLSLVCPCLFPRRGGGCELISPAAMAVA